MNSRGEFTILNLVFFSMLLVGTGIYFTMGFYDLVEILLGEIAAQVTGTILFFVGLWLIVKKPTSFNFSEENFR